MSRYNFITTISNPAYIITPVAKRLAEFTNLQAWKFLSKYLGRSRFKRGFRGGGVKGMGSGRDSEGFGYKMVVGWERGFGVLD